MRIFIFTFLSIFFLMSCNSPMDKGYNEANYLQDIQKIRESNTINYEDVELLTKYIAVLKLSGNEPKGESYKNILEKIKAIKKSSSDENANQEFQKDAARERLGGYVTVDLTEKSFTKKNEKDVFSISVFIKNNSQKNIKMIVGSLNINDLIGRKIKSIQILLDEPLKANGGVTKNFILRYDPANENDIRLRAKDLIDLRIVWDPEKIIFEDGHMAE